MPSSQPENHLKSEHYNCEAMRIASMPGGGTTIKDVHDAIEAHTQSKLKAFAGEYIDAIPDEVEMKVGTVKIPLNDIERGYNLAIQDVNEALKAIKEKYQL